MADLNDFELPVYTTNYHDTLDTLRENIKRVRSSALGAIPYGEKGAAGGVAPLDGSGKVHPGHMPPGVVFDAASDGVHYVRRNGLWVPMPVQDDSAMLGTIAMKAIKAGISHPAWIELIGQDLIKTSYPRLWAWVQTYGPLAANATDWANNNPGMFLNTSGTLFRLPKVDTFFLRVASSGRTPGSRQAEMIGPHAHPAVVNDPGHTHAYSAPTGQNFVYGTGGDPAISNQASTLTVPSLAGVTVTVNANSGTENRPANIAYRAFIYAGVPL